MRLEIVPFTPDLIDQAAALLAARHRAGRGRLPVLPARYDDPAVTRPLVARAFAAPRTGGVAALLGGRMAGYLLAEIVLTGPTSFEALTLYPRAARAHLMGHAVGAGNGGEIYREMYAALAPRWLAAGCFTHYVQVPAFDQEAVDAWFSLGFGLQSVRGVCGTEPVERAAALAGITIRRAGRDDIDAVAELSEGLSRYHAGSPLFLPYLPEAQVSARDHHHEALASPEHTYWLAFRDGRAVAMQTFGPPSSASRLVTPERCIHLENGYTTPEARGTGAGTALLDRALAWAREAGYVHCTVSWMSANLLAARFWRRSGFRPIAYRLLRVVDERIAWAT